MKQMFIAAVAAVFSLAMASCCQNPVQQEKKDIAVQLYSIRDLISRTDGNVEAFNALLADLAEMGYTAVEAANYNDGKFYGQTPEQFKAAVEAVGMRVLSSHVGKALSAEELASGDFSESLEWWDTCIAAHKAAGMEYIVTPWLDVPKTVKDLQTYCEYYDAIGKKCAENGMKYGYHNHAHEFQKVENSEMMYDYMISHTDPQYVFFEMDVYWAVIGNASPVEYFNRYPGRFKVLHIKDEKEIGQSGMVGFDAIFKNVGTAGVENIVVEVERYSTDDIAKSIGESIDYLKEASFVPASYGM